MRLMTLPVLMRRKIAAGVLLAVVVTGCGGNSATSAPAPGMEATVTATTAASEPIAAMVNNEAIPLSALEATVQRGLAGIRSVGDAMPADLNAYREAMLETLIEDKLIEQAARIQGVTVTDEEVEAEIQATINLAGGRDKWLEQIAAESMTEANYRERIRLTLITHKMRDIVTKSSCVGIEQVHARHILVDSESVALEIRKQIEAGADFGQLAAQYSRDVSTKDTGGDLGWFARGQLLQSIVEDVAFSQAANAISAPVKSDLGYHIIQTLEKATDRPVAPDACFQLSRATFERWLQELFAKATIQRYPNGK